MAIFHCSKCKKQTEHESEFKEPTRAFVKTHTEYTCEECGQRNYVRVKRGRRKSTLYNLQDYGNARARGKI